MSDIKNIIEKFKIAKIDKPAAINNTVLFLLSWIATFFVFQFFTVIPAFSLGVKMILYNTFIDFNNVNTASSDLDLWSNEENIYTVFFTPVIFCLILALTACLFLIKWNSDRLHIRRFLFWLILCLIIRIGGNFMFGHIFNLWNWNLVTDFLGLTYPSMLFKYGFVVLTFIIIAGLFSIMSKEIKRLFNPYLANRINDLISNIFIPVFVGSIILVILCLPYFPKNELCCIGLMFIMTTFFLCRSFVRTYRGIAQEDEGEDDEQINLIPIIILSILVIISFILAKGWLLENSAYRSYFVENTIMIAFIFVAILTLTISIIVYNRRAKALKKAWDKEKREIDYLNSINKHSGIENWETGNKINLDKYKHSFNDSEDETNEENNDDFVPIDLKNSEKYGFKRYNLSKYDQHNF